MRHALLLIALFFLVTPRGGEAQGVFDFKPDTLFYTSGEEQIVMTNVSPDTVLLESMSIYWGEEFATAWEIIAVGDPTDGEEYYFASGFPQYPDTLEVNLLFTPQDTLSLFFYFDACTVCLDGELNPDTLVFHSNGQFGADSLLLDTNGYETKNENGPERNPIIRLKPQPNPASELVEFKLDLDKATEITISVLDPRGRQVVELERGLISAGENLFRWNSSGVAPGLYFVRVQSDEDVIIKTITIIH